MRRFLWAAVLALSIHVLLLGFGGRFLDRRMVKPLPRTLSFTLVAHQQTPEKTENPKAPSQKEVPRAPVPEERVLTPEAPLFPIDEERAPVVEHLPDSEEEAEEPIEEEPPKDEPVKEKPPEPEKAEPKIVPPPEKKPEKTVEAPEPKKKVKVLKPPEPKKPAPPPGKKVKPGNKKKVAKRPPKKTRVVKKAPEVEPPKQPPKKEAMETPKKTVSIGEKASKPSDASLKRSDAGPEAAAASGPKVVKASPAYAQNPRPKYPRVARRRGYEGAVMLKVMVDREGRASEVLILKSSGYGVLDRSAVKAVKTWVFKPGTVDGRRAEMWVQVPVRFELKGR